MFDLVVLWSNMRNFKAILLILALWATQEASVKKKYGGIMPKKPPLISKVT